MLLTIIVHIFRTCFSNAHFIIQPSMCKSLKFCMNLFLPTSFLYLLEQYLLMNSTYFEVLLFSVQLFNSYTCKWCILHCSDRRFVNLTVWQWRMNHWTWSWASSDPYSLSSLSLMVFWGISLPEFWIHFCLSYMSSPL